MKTMEFRIEIAAPPETVWSTMLDGESFTRWTAPFAKDSYFDGSWDEGARIRFLVPSGEGMSSVIAEHRPHEVVRIEHRGIVKDGVEDLTSDEVRAWAPAYETYRFEAVEGGTEVTVEQDTAPEHEAFMAEIWPKSLAILKGICEG